mmetsp:Transcript_64556/g.76431  ORF Transcript_64556/g.76431 Transcript_64556/m.76431 type:complete len:86 (-) Transcript_64556:226-483(-)
MLSESIYCNLFGATPEPKTRLSTFIIFPRFIYSGGSASTNQTFEIPSKYFIASFAVILSESKCTSIELPYVEFTLFSFHVVQPFS